MLATFFENVPMVASDPVLYLLVVAVARWGTYSKTH